MKTVRYHPDALRRLKRYGNVAARLRRALDECAAETGAHANNVTRLVGSPAFRLRVGDFRAIFEETETDIFVTVIAPRGSVYDLKGRPMNDSDTVTLTRAAYEDLIDARDHSRAMRDIATGAVETLTGAEVDAYLQAPSNLAFWRRHRGMTQAALAAEIGITQPSLAQARYDLCQAGQGVAG